MKRGGSKLLTQGCAETAKPGLGPRGQSIPLRTTLPIV